MRIAIRRTTPGPRVIAAVAIVLVIAEVSPWAAPAAQQPSDVAVDSEGRAGEQQQAGALCDEGDALFQRAQYAPAREQALKCAGIFERLAIPTGVGRANQLLAGIADLSGDLAESESRARRAVAAYEAAGDGRGRAVATLQLVRVAKLERTENLRLVERAVRDARVAGDRSIEARALHSKGDHLFTAGAYEDALDALNQAAAAFESIGERRSLGRVYNSIGRLYRVHERRDEALTYQLRALAIHETTDSPFELLQSLNAVAVTYQGLADPRSARPYLERALVLAERTSSPRIQDFLRANLAAVLVDEGADAKAAAILEEVLARGVDSFPAVRLRDLARIYLRLGRREEAAALAERAMASCKVADVECVDSLDLRAEVHAASGRREAALSDVTAALDKIEVVRAKLVPADFFKQQFSAAQEAIYSRAIDIHLRDGRAGEALATAELARSRAFVDLLASKALSPRDAVVAGGASRSGAGLNAIDGLPLTYRGTTAAPAGEVRPDLPSTIAAPASTTADLVATAKRLHSTLLAYWVTNDRLFIWVVGADGRVQASTVDAGLSRLTELVRATSPSVRNPASASNSGPARAPTTRGTDTIKVQADNVDAWRQLYDLLVKPVRSHLPRQAGSLLTIVPSGPLSALTFAALLDERGRYLLEDYTLHYAPAGAVLAFTASRRHAAARTGDVLLVVDPVPPTLSKLDAPLPRLPGARAEARAIAGLIPRTRITSLAGDTATEEAIRAATSGKAVVHFATHAIVNDQDPFGSFLAVSPGRDKLNPGSEGLLTAREIYEMNLDADLVVLSACRSAGGRVRGDGIATFARAFIYAGTPTLVASMWDVADQPANRLLPDFYRGWIGGATKARALRSAQLRLLRDLRAGTVQVDTPLGKILLPEHPVFWAGFVLFGEP